MIFLIITHVPHSFQKNQFFGYAPYIREMNVWLKYLSKVIIIAPLENRNPSQIEIAYNHQNIIFIAVPSFNINSVNSLLKSFFTIPKIIFTLFKQMFSADHIHLRCPGNMGLLGCIVQIFFPNKVKTAKYAGNWDLKSKQPYTYKLQQYILNNTFLTRNIQVLVYGEWENISKNIKPFFTATYLESEINKIVPKRFDKTTKFVFVGTLVTGKNALYAIKIVQNLAKVNHQVKLDLYGEGDQRIVLENYVKTNNLHEFIFIHGNKDQETIKKAYQESHFTILPSASEGWPKAIAEGMFWACVPVATSVSCVPDMLNYGERGLLLTLDLENDCKKLTPLLNFSSDYQIMSQKAANWSRKYTLDFFEQEIKLLLQV